MSWPWLVAVLLLIAWAATLLIWAVCAGDDEEELDEEPQP